MKKNSMSLFPPKIRAYGSCIVKDKLWFFTGKFNGLAYIDLQNMHMEYVDKVPDENIWTDQLYVDIVHYKGSLILVPSFAREIAIYNIEKKQFTKLEVQEPPIHLKKHFLINRKFKKAIILGDSVYFLPNGYPAIVELNMTTGILYYYNEWVEEVHRLGMNGYGYSANFPVLSGTIIYMIPTGGSLWLEYDTQSKTTTVCERKIAESCCCMAKMENKWILVEASGKIVICQSDENEKGKIIRVPQELPQNVSFFAYHAIALGKKIYILTHNDTLLQIDADTGDVTTLKEQSGKAMECWGFICEYQQQLLYYDGKQGMITIYTQDGKLKKKVNLVIPDFFIKKNQIGLLGMGDDEHPEGDLLLDEYLKLLYMIEIDETKKNAKNDIKTIGSSIFRQMDK